ncbi:MAG: N-acetylmuramate alpha-1-phosphate uridylyltransferase MurU [Burkholderiaceae bacterium]
MRAMVLAAGRGERMRPLTDHLPKPLLSVAGQALIAWHLQGLAKAGFCDVFINTAHLGQKIEEALGDGHHFGLRLQYSREPEGALETAGGIAMAQPWRPHDEPFLVINGDIFCQWPFIKAIEIGQGLEKTRRTAALSENTDAADRAATPSLLGHLVMVPNPPHHPKGDFCLLEGGRLGLAESSEQDTLTYSGIGVFLPSLFQGITPGTRAALGPLLKSAIAAGRMQGEAYTGPWTDVGTPERLAALNQQLLSTKP